MWIPANVRNARHHISRWLIRAATPTKEPIVKRCANTFHREVCDSRGRSGPDTTEDATKFATSAVVPRMSRGEGLKNTLVGMEMVFSNINGGAEQLNM
jgi:hypothetical protein